MISRPIRHRLRWMRWPLIASGGLLVAAAPAGWAVRGPVGAVAATAGVLVVVVSYLASGIVIAWADSINPKLVLPIGLVTYVTKLVVLGVALLGLAATGWPGVGPMAVAMLTAIVVWLTAQVWWTARAHIPYVEIDDK